MDNTNFKIRRKYISLIMKIITTIFLMILVGYNLTFKKEPNNVWFTLLGSIPTLWASSLEKGEDEKEDQKP